MDARKNKHICLHCGRYKVPRDMQKQVKSQSELIDYFYQLGGFEMKSGLTSKLTSDENLDALVDAVHDEQIYPFIRSLTKVEYERLITERRKRVRAAIEKVIG